MPTPFKNSFFNGTDIDSDEKKVKPNTLRYLKNLLWNVNNNSSSGATQGSNAGVLTPLEATEYLTGSISMGAGINLCIGYKDSEETNEGFVFVYNTRGAHFIYSVSAINGNVQIVYKGPQLNFKYAPENFIAYTRCVVRVMPYVNNKTGLKATRTFILFTDWANDIRCICKEDSIVTGSYNTSTFPFFTPLAIPTGKLVEYTTQYISLAIAPPNKCIQISAAPLVSGDEKKQNLLVDKGYQFRLKFVDIYGRETEHGIISDRFFLVTGNSCLANSTGLARCLNLTFDVGNPFIDKIQVEYRLCVGNTDFSVDSGWVLSEVINKYDNVSGVEWWERNINPDYAFNSSDNTFTYKFCADKLSSIIDQTETIRLFNPVPLTAASIIALNKGIAIGNNERDFEPVEPAELDKITFTVTPPTVTACDNIAVREIVVYAFIWKQVQGVGVEPPDSLNGRIHYNPDNKLYYCGTNIPYTGSDLDVVEYFPLGVSGFTGFLAGTGYATISEQIIFYTDNQTEGSIDTIDAGRPHLWAQKFKYLVLPGKYAHRIASHKVSPSTPGFQQTSTFVCGLNRYDSIFFNNSRNLSSIKKELIIDVCDTSYTENVMLMKIEQINYGFVTAVSGYVYEDEIGKVPVELCPVDWDCSNGTQSSCWYTDHNGFYFNFATVGGGGDRYYDMNFHAQLCTTVQSIHYVGTTQLYHLNHDVFFFTTVTAFPANARRLFKGKIHVCGSPTIGIPGMPVVLENGQYVFTDTNGDWTIIAHNRYNHDYVFNNGHGVGLCEGPATAELFDWQAAGDTILFTQNGQCQLQHCDNCSMCFPEYTQAWQACTGPNRIYTFSPLEASLRGINKSGPKNGGRYGAGVTYYDWAGRADAIQATPDYFVDIPSILTIKAFDFSKIGFNILSTFNAPVWARYMSFSLTKNLNWKDDIMWVADRITFVDGVGAEGVPNPTKIRIYYESLVEYGAQNNYSNNNGWQILDTDNNAVLGDRVEFIQRPDGTWYDTTLSALIRFNKEGKYFDLDYNQELADLKSGTLIKLIRPELETTNNIFWELCPMIRIVDRKPELLTGTFNYSDSYMLNRTIPTPIYTPDPTAPEDRTKDVRTVVNRPYTYFYEHHSPSDFWGDHCRTLGRVNTRNIYEKKKFLGSEVALSKALVNKSAFNGLSYFDTADVTAFDEQEWGMMTGMVVENNTILFIFEKDNFVVGFNDTTVRTDDNGNVMAASVPNRFGQPQRKLGSNFGCIMRDINTIQKRDGLVVFLDSSESILVFHNFSKGEDISTATLTKSWVERAVSTVKGVLNDGNSKYSPYFVGGIDPKNNEYYLTKFNGYRNPVAIDNAGSSGQFPLSYVNNELDINLAKNETLVYGMNKGSIMFKGFVSPTPEYYGPLINYYKDKTLLQMKGGHSYSIHNANPAAGFNKFFGVQGKKVIRIITNLSAEKVKHYLWNEIYCKEHGFSADQIITESGQLSRIVLSRWERVNNFYTAEFLCDLNTIPDPQLPIATGPNVLLDGDLLYGEWLMARYVSEDADDEKYCEISAIVTYVAPFEKSAD